MIRCSSGLLYRECIRLHERIALRPGAKRGLIDTTLQEEPGTIPSWPAAHDRKTGPQTKLPQPALREFRILVAGTCSHLKLLLEATA